MSELSIQQNKARLKVKGKSWDNVATDSGHGLTIDQIIVAEIEELTGIDLPEIDDNTHVIVGYEDGEPVIYIDDDIHDEPFDLDDLDLDDLDLDWELDTEIYIDDVIISVDVDLNIKKDDLPDHIEIVTLPNKLTYYDGQTINITGMRVVPKREDDSTWTNSKYFRGYIPLQELMIEPLKADKDELIPSGKTSILDTSPVTQPIPYGTSITIECKENGGNERHWIYHIYGLPVLIISSGNDDRTYAIACGAPGDTFYWDFYNIRDGTQEHNSQTLNHTSGSYYGKSIAYATFDLGSSYVPVVNKTGPSIENVWNDVDKAEVAWTLYYGNDVGGVQEISVTWKRYGDNEPLSTTFEIEVEEPGGGGR